MKRPELQTLSDPVNEALRERLGRPRASSRKPFVAVTTGEGGVHHGVEVTSNAQVRDLMGEAESARDDPLAAVRGALAAEMSGGADIDQLRVGARAEEAALEAMRLEGAPKTCPE